MNTISRSELSGIDESYFSLIEATPFYIVLQSRNTGHFWYLLHLTMNGHTSYKISHKHNLQDPFHPQTSRPSISAACEYIRQHDAYHLRREERKEKRRKEGEKRRGRR